MKQLIFNEANKVGLL